MPANPRSRGVASRNHCRELYGREQTLQRADARLLAAFKAIERMRNQPESEMFIGGDILNVPTEIRIRDKLQSYGVNRRSEEMEEALYREYVASITVSSEVMAVLVSMPEIASIEQAKEYLRETRGTRHPASSEPRSPDGLRSMAARFWRHVVAHLSLDDFGKPHSRYPGVN